MTWCDYCCLAGEKRLRRGEEALVSRVRTVGIDGVRKAANTVDPDQEVTGIDHTAGAPQAVVVAHPAATDIGIAEGLLTSPIFVGKAHPKFDNVGFSSHFTSIGTSFEHIFVVGG